MQEKTFFLENQQNSVSEFVKCPIAKSARDVDLFPVLQHIPTAHQKLFKIYNPQIDDYVNLSLPSKAVHNPYIVSKQLLRMSMVIIKYNENPDYMAKDEYEESEESNKKERSRQRNIREVIELVQRWREYHDNPPDGKKKTLQQAAKFVGVSKKSLDDYYYQLRVGEKHNFDFTAHFEDKIGVLRAFLKIKQPERKAEGRNAKHPKKLKIIEQFSEKLKIIEAESKISSVKAENRNIVKVLQTPKPAQKIEKTEIAKIQSIKREPSVASANDPFESIGEDQLFWGSPFTPLSQQKFMDCEKNFYNEFDFVLDDPGDPYLPFTDLMNKKSNRSQDQF